MKSTRKKIVFITIGIIVSVIIIAFLADFAFNLYEENRLSKLPRLQTKLEINVQKYLQVKAMNKDESFDAVMDEVKKEIEVDQGLDVLNLVQAKFYAKQIPLSKYFGKKSDSDNLIISNLNDMIGQALAKDVKVIQNRLEQYGIIKPLVLKQNEKQITVEIPFESKSENKLEEIKKLLQGDALLEFRILKDPELTFVVMSRIDSVLAGELNKSSGLSQTTDYTNMELTEEEFSKKHPFFAAVLLDPQGRTADAYIKEEDKGRVENFMNRFDVKNVIPTDVEFVFSAKTLNSHDGIEYYLFYCVNRYPELSGEIISGAEAKIDPITSAPIITMEMNTDGTKEWERITEKNIGKRIAIMLDGVVYTAPVVKGKIPGGRSQIDGMESIEDAKLLEIVLKAGALPAPLDIISQEFIEKK